MMARKSKIEQLSVVGDVGAVVDSHEKAGGRPGLRTFSRLAVRLKGFNLSCPTVRAAPRTIQDACRPAPLPRPAIKTKPNRR